eukprot:scaffold76652_cov31-Tisochrysis_lutea.AAC.7
MRWVHAAPPAGSLAVHQLQATLCRRAYTEAHCPLPMSSNAAYPLGGRLREVLLVLLTDDLWRGALALALHRKRDYERQGALDADALQAQGEEDVWSAGPGHDHAATGRPPCSSASIVLPSWPRNLVGC